MMDAAVNSSAAGVHGGDSFYGLRRGDRIVWTQPDHARILVEVVRLKGDYVYLRCYYADKQWTRKHRLPLFPSMRREHWTTDDIVGTTL